MHFDLKVPEAPTEENDTDMRGKYDKSRVFILMKGGKFNIRRREQFCAICLGLFFLFPSIEGLIAGWWSGGAGKLLVTNVTRC